MGCSASRPNTLLTKNNYHHHPEENNPSSFSSFVENSKLSSQYPSPQPVPRALSLQSPLVHHPPSRKGDSHHLVSLTSTTYGSLLLIEPISNKLHQQNPTDQAQSPPNFTKDTHKAPQALQADPGDSLSPDSVINTWELMDGLDDDMDWEKVEPLNSKSSLSDHSFELPSRPALFQQLVSGDCVKKLHDECFDSVKKSEETTVENNSFSLSKPLWKHLSEESLLSKMDPNVVSSYRRALSSRQLLGSNKESKNVRSAGSSPITNNGFFLHGTEDKIVLYFTSLRGIRKTYEDCYAVRMIFRGFRVPVDERDISMDFTYRKELQSVLKGKAMSLPQVFIRGKHMGGVEEIRQLNEAGELARFLEGFPVRDPSLVCESCGDARFVPCPNCNGSRKVFDAGEEQLRRCPDCNENGLIRCPGCCS